MLKELDMVANSCKVSPQEAEAGRLLAVQDQPKLYTTFLKKHSKTKFFKKKKFMEKISLVLYLWI